MAQRDLAVLARLAPISRVVQQLPQDTMVEAMLRSRLAMPGLRKSTVVDLGE
ncbi:hypothetical protein IU494_30335 [Nocardia terpenica]|uniref:hypothetical protein n=1 Tax=Nocardia terpenica TaxID=455432 RepID=UPI001894AF7C|nr:hypothetical protein [Nocardia terpenica]MBF6064947.1 hypothetical protein [Nocardia terpenica]MBF6115219.1 hypothetical protein [Nocardia terpenica]MBF6122541.1 hypothetical protein [Nocardia terpenica]